MPEKENKALKFLFMLSWFGILALVLYSFREMIDPVEKMRGFSIITNISIGLLISCASFVSGAFGGFLFGIPKSLSQSTADTTKGGYADNDNLVQVSDWLTKIIVGVGLTQLTKIPGYMNSLGDCLKGSYGNDEIAKIASVSLVLYFLICGFLMCYLWTRVYFKQMLGEADNEYASIKNNLDQLNDYIAIGAQPIEHNNKSFIKPVYKDTKGNIRTSIKRSPDDDPQKYLWGEKPENNGRKLKATVTPSTVSKDYFNVEIAVTSTDLSKPLKGDVVFHLHPSFRNPDPTIEAVNGEAKLNILAWNAFTVGAEADEGETILELDLAELSDAPQLFKSR